MHVLIGTAGHIDHGKTSLVRRLTGIDTDRLPEEKARGISIDLGFAHFESGGVEFGVIDVPGHERFVRAMVAGATGINLAMLVIAADDGVMPQTREHLEIMDLLGIRSGLVVLTKIDLVEPDLQELVAADIASSLKETFLSGCPIVPVSSSTGAGIEQLLSELRRLAESVRLADASPFFRLPIDRVFSIAGHGTVVTGSTLSGSVRAGDMLQLWPEGTEVRVRGVERHGLATDLAQSRQRIAINLAGIKHSEVQRGNELATPGTLRKSHRLLVELRVLKSSAASLRDRSEVSLHLGTTEVIARVSLKGRELAAGEKGFAELRLMEPVVAAWGQRVILRRISPAMTIGGGRVLDPVIPDGLRLRDVEVTAARLASDDACERLSLFLSQRDSAADLEVITASAIGIGPDELPGLLARLRQDRTLVRIGSAGRQWELHAERLAGLSQSITRIVREEILKHQPRRSLSKSTLIALCSGIAPTGLLDAVFDHLVQTKALVRMAENFGPAELQVQLTKQQRQQLNDLLSQTTTAGLAPPSTKEFAAAFGAKQSEIERLMVLLVEDGLLVRAVDGFYFSASAVDSAIAVCRALITSSGPVTMAQLRDAWGITRKHAVPLCEFLDATGITQRSDDLRVLAHSSSTD